jgi:phosphoglycolate phosphatase
MIEQIRGRALGRPARAVMFDFDGTVALVRAGWMPVMLDMMMQTLGPLGSDQAALRAEAEDYVARFTGKDTLHQMSAFVDHVRALGGEPLSATRYKADFIAMLEAERAERLSAVQSGRRPASDLLVPGTVPLLEALRARGLRVYLASGTAHEVVSWEAEFLDIARLFDGIYGSAPGLMTKRELLEWIVESGVGRDELLTFGDGRVEIEDTRAAGGTAVGVATDEESGCFEVDAKKRGWLIAAGADYIIPNYLDKDVMRIVSGEM